MDKPNKGQTGKPKGADKVSRGVDPKKEDWIGRQLRRVYDDAISEPLPDDLMALLRQIDTSKDDKSSSR